MRLVVGLILVGSAESTLASTYLSITAAISILMAGAGLLLILGLFTPIAGIVVALAELAGIPGAPAEKLVYVLLATSGAALAMLGPGLWSIDARLFGWKRIEPTPRKR